MIVLGRSDCDVRRAEYLRTQAGIIGGLEETARRTGATLVRFDDLLCRGSTCRTVTDDGVSIYKDSGHLSILGSAGAVPRLGLDVVMGNLEATPQPTAVP